MVKLIVKGKRAKQGTDRRGKAKARLETKIFGLARREWLFLIKFFALFLIPYALIHIIDLGWLTSAIASTESWLFNAAGIPSSVVGSEIIAAGTSYTIIADCTGLVMVAMLFALLWATPLKDKRRWLFLAIGVPFLLLFNLARLFVTLWAGVALGPVALEAVHLCFWFVDAAAAVAVWAKAAELW